MSLLSRDLLRWYDAERRAMPWREVPGPYRTWVSEAMLQQTKVETVLPYFERFMAAFPSVEALASANERGAVACYQHRGRAATGVVVARHRHAVRAGREHRQQIPFNHVQRPVATDPVAAFADRADHISFTVWDVGGQDKIRPLWRHYFQNTQGEKS